jgi:hypothetical protein
MEIEAYNHQANAAYKIYKELERQLKEKNQLLAQKRQ